MRGVSGGRSYIQGHVEILHENVWGTICDDDFDNNDATVICKMAGYSVGEYKNYLHIGLGVSSENECRVASAFSLSFYMFCTVV